MEKMINWHGADFIMKDVDYQEDWRGAPLVVVLLCLHVVLTFIIGNSA